MASPAGLQLFLGNRLPDAALQRIFEFGWHLWLAKPYDVETDHGQWVMHLVRFEDIKPDVYVSEIWFPYDEVLDVEQRVEMRWRWSKYYEEEYLRWIPDQEDIIGLARPIVRAKRRARHHGAVQNGEGGYWDSGYTNCDGSVVHIWHFRPVHVLKRSRREPSSSSSSDWDFC